MNILFLLLASSLVLIALLIIIPPLWRSRKIINVDMNARNTAIAKQQLHELKTQLQNETITLSDYELQRTELELALSDNLQADSMNHSFIAHRYIVYVLMILVPLLSGGLYAYLGAFQAIEPTAEMLGINNNSNNPSLADIEKMVAKLAAHAKANPNDAKAWLMLGKSYKYLQQYDVSAEAFAHAYSLLGEQAEIMLLYADALAFAQNEQLAGKPAELVFKALQLEPTNIQALWLGGMAKAQAGQLNEAIVLWQKLQQLLPDNSPAKQETEQLIAKVKTQLTESDIPAAINENVEINVQVNLADNLKSLVSDTDTVFIYAKAEGQKMPLAIIRKQVKDLPIHVVLNDALAMMPTLKLSNFKTINIVARVSKSAQAISQEGDLIGTINNVAITDKDNHVVIINEQIK